MDYSITQDGRVQLILQFHDQQKEMDSTIDYDVRIVQEDGLNTKSGYERVVLYTPSDSAYTNGKKIHESEILFYTVNKNNQIVIEVTILGVGDTFPYPKDFEETKPTVYQMILASEKAFRGDFVP